MSKLKVKVSAKDGKAQDLLQALQNLPIKEEVRQNRIPNFVSNDALFIPAGANSSKQKGSERLPDNTQDPRPGEVRQNRSEAEYKAHAFPPVQDDQVKVSWDALDMKPTSLSGSRGVMPANSPEAMRQKLNRHRDARTNLGKGKQSVVET